MALIRVNTSRKKKPRKWINLFITAWLLAVNGTQKVPSLGTVRNILGGTWGDIRTATLRRMRAAWAN
jgi:ABC-type Co2+ transport system permease subunit